MNAQSGCKTLAAALVTVLLAGCSVKRIAVNRIGNALASGGSSYERDDDPDLVGEALPFGLKLMESLLAESPRHTGLLLAAASGFTEYSYAFVDQAADETAAVSLERSGILRARARRLYRRAQDYGMRGLEVRYPGFAAALDQSPAAALGRVHKRDAPLLYWTAAAQGLAISDSKDQPEMLARLTLVEALIRRVMELDPFWQAGAVQEFLISLESADTASKPEVRQRRMKRNFERALTLSGGARASLYVSYAENACVPAQDRAEFTRMLQTALRVDPDRQPDYRLANLVAQRRAKWLLGRTGELFLVQASDLQKENQ